MDLLTVHSAFIQPCARRLYRSPFDVIAKFNGAQAKEAAVHQLLSLVLHASTSQDPQIQALRNRFYPDLTTFHRKPFVDYLSFITIMNFSQTTTGQTQWWCEGLGDLNNDIMDALVWASCGHRLAETQSISLIRPDASRYAPYADQLANLGVIDIVLVSNGSPPLHGIDPSLPNQIRSAIHLVRLICDAWTVSGRWARQPPAISLDCLNGPDAWWQSDNLTPLLREFFGLLPVHTPIQLAPIHQYDRCREWICFYYTMERVALDHLSTLVTWGRVGQGDKMDFKAVSFPTSNKASVLQRCRKLTCLGLVIEDESEELVLDWMVEETQANIAPFVQQYGTPYSQVGGFSDRILLEDLRLASMSSRQINIARPLANAVTACRQTLQSIDALAWNSRVDIVIFHSMPQLRALSLRVAHLSCSGEAFKDCPNLRKLSLHDFDYDDDVNGMDEDDDEPPGNDDDAVFEHPWRLSALENLTLQGAVAFRFHQASLQHMPNLISLTLQSDYIEQVCPWTEYNLEPRYWQALPSLHDLTLEGEMALAFRWSMMTTAKMPQLHRLVLKAPPGFPESTFPIQELLDTAGTSMSPAEISARLPRIRELRLHHWTIPSDIYGTTLSALTPDLRCLVVEAPTLPEWPILERMRALWPKLERCTMGYSSEMEV
ncbi:hypothetical protein DFQ27_000134 [Actinomortierella ambigua]|uniref:Uncharacterized protein n=1 Tax=Actinomortierella ambigua TaxID=1343610 RepID=A0A9P6UA26_9FUNG|nr:hypothetical protein DFQ27_000134 [Actinomortierella ambigua]